MSPLVIFGRVVAHLCTVLPSFAADGGRPAKRRRHMVGRNKGAKQAASCAGKARHESHEGAAIEARRTGDGRVRPYQCEFCDGWHVGNARPGP